jgi:hypothetical protein
MGYSLTDKASRALTEIAQYMGMESSNTWTHNGEIYFEERGRENADGAYTASIHRIRGGNCYPAGRVRIEADGFVTAWSNANQGMRAAIKRHNAAIAAFRSGAMFAIV